MNASYTHPMHTEANAIQITIITTPPIRLTGFPFLKISCACARQSDDTDSGINLIANARWYQDKIIQIAKNRYRVRDWIDRAESISDEPRVALHTTVFWGHAPQGKEQMFRF